MPERISGPSLMPASTGRGLKTLWKHPCIAWCAALSIPYLWMWRRSASRKTGSPAAEPLAQLSDCDMTNDALYDQIATHQSHRAEYGLTVSGYSGHPDAFVRWVADMGKREGEFIRAETNRPKLKAAAHA